MESRFDGDKRRESLEILDEIFDLDEGEIEFIEDTLKRRIKRGESEDGKNNRQL